MIVVGGGGNRQAVALLVADTRCLIDTDIAAGILQDVTVEARLVAAANLVAVVQIAMVEVQG